MLPETSLPQRCRVQSDPMFGFWLILGLAGRRQPEERLRGAGGVARNLLGPRAILAFGVRAGGGAETHGALPIFEMAIVFQRRRKVNEGPVAELWTDRRIREAHPGGNIRETT